MLQLIKKDLMVSLKIKSLKVVIGVFIIGLFLLTALPYAFPILTYKFPTLLPIILIYIIVMNSFYYDSLNKSEEFILSLPNKKEDAVYSKYILTLIVLFTSIIIIYILFEINLLRSARVMVMQDVVVTVITILFSFGIIIPIIFKWGYRIARNIGPFITILIGHLVYNNQTISHFMSYGEETLLLRFSRKIGVCIYNIFSLNNIFSLKSYDFRIMSVNIYFIIIVLILAILCVVSMYISLKIYKKKDIA